MASTHKPEALARKTGSDPRSEALPRNALLGRLCLPAGKTRQARSCGVHARQSLAESEFPGRAWELERRAGGNK